MRDDGVQTGPRAWRLRRARPPPSPGCQFRSRSRRRIPDQAEKVTKVRATMTPVPMLALPVLWVACAVAGYLYSLQQNIPAATMLAALPAFLLEATFYFVMGVEGLRTRIEKLPPAVVALALTLAAVAPYSAASLALGSFRWQAMLWIGGLAAVASFWYVLLPHKPASDI